MNPRKSGTGKSGFTLLELLVTLTIASLLLTVVAPRLVDSVAHARLRASAARISVALREARAAARITSQPVSLTISGTGGGYGAAGRDFALPRGQTLTFAPYRQFADDRSDSLAFLPDGSSSGGTMTVAHGRDQIRIDIDWLTGRVSVGD